VPFVRGLLHARRSTADDGRLDENAETARARPARTFAHVVALTAINPATVLYVTALTAALADRIRSLGARLAFLARIGIGLFGWQATFAGFGAHLGRRPRASLQRRTRQIGAKLDDLRATAPRSRR